MRTLEDDPRFAFRAFSAVIETLTTTGYGADACGIEQPPLDLDDRLSISPCSECAPAWSRRSPR